MVKVNICGGVPERKGTFTSLEVADVLADLIQSAGGKPTFVDADMIWIKFWRQRRDPVMWTGPRRKVSIW